MLEDLKFININLQRFASDDIEDNALSNFDDFVSGEDADEYEYDDTENTEADEQEEYEDESEEETEEPEEEELEKEEKKPLNKKIKQDVNTNKRQLSKQEYALVQAKKENKSLKELIRSMNERLANIEKTETERSLESNKHRLIQTYIEKGFDEETAVDLANDKIEKEMLKNDFNSIKKELEALKNGKESYFDTKTQTEQSLLYKQAKAKKAKVDVGTAGSTTVSEGFKMTSEQKRDWEALQKTPWGKGMSKKDFLKSWNESFR